MLQRAPLAREACGGWPLGTVTRRWWRDLE